MLGKEHVLSSNAKRIQERSDSRRHKWRHDGSSIFYVTHQCFELLCLQKIPNCISRRITSDMKVPSGQNLHLCTQRFFQNTAQIFIIIDFFSIRIFPQNSVCPFILRNPFCLYCLYYGLIWHCCCIH